MSATPSQTREGAVFEHIFGAICSRFGAEVVHPVSARDPVRIRAASSEFAVRIYDEDGWPSRASPSITGATVFRCARWMSRFALLSSA